MKADPTTSKQSNSLIIFARYPRLGRVKTRLEPTLGAQRCLALYEAMLADCVHRSSLIDCSLHVYLHGCDFAEARTLVARVQGPAELEISVGLQKGADLGERMWNAHREVSRFSSRVAIVGSDSPSIPLRFIRLAFDLLAENPIILGPVEDGGYYLIGLSRPRREIFEDIQWGTSSVLSQTMVKLARSDYALLPEWYDIDSGRDLDRLIRDLAHSFEGYPARTADYLNEAKLLSSAVPFSSLEEDGQC